MEASRNLFYSNMGKIIYLWGLSSVHKNWPVYLIEQYAQPALELKQYLILEDVDGSPLAYVSWAFLTIDAEVKYLNNPHSLLPMDWAGGDRVWFTSFVSPIDVKFTMEMINRLRSTIFSKTVARSLRIKSNSNVSRVVFHWGLEVTPIQRRATLKHLYQTAKQAITSKKIVWGP